LSAVLESGKHPAAVRESISSPRGCTIHIYLDLIYIFSFKCVFPLTIASAKSDLVPAFSRLRSWFCRGLGGCRLFWSLGSIQPRLGRVFLRRGGVSNISRITLYLCIYLDLIYIFSFKCVFPLTIASAKIRGLSAVLESGKHPAAVRESISSPRGCTIQTLLSVVMFSESNISRITLYLCIYLDLIYIFSFKCVFPLTNDLWNCTQNDSFQKWPFHL
jgi:hypothetical protein